MRRLRWLTDGGHWDLDREAPVTMEGTARPVPGDPLPLGLSRGVRLSRSKQLDFIHRFMSGPLVPSFAGDPSNGGASLLLHHAHTLHLAENWSATVQEQFDIQKLYSCMKQCASDHLNKIPWHKSLVKNMVDIFSLGFDTEFLITPDSSVLVETYNIKKGTRGKAIFHHEFPKHNLMVEAVCPGLFVDKNGAYWDVPLSMAIDLASIASSSGLSYHLCLQHNSGAPKHFGGNQTSEIPAALLAGLYAKAAVSIKKNVNMWRKEVGKLKMVQPYDAFLSEPHVSGLGIIGAVATASLGDNSARLPLRDASQSWKAFSLCTRKDKFALIADLFATVSCSAQHGNFQRLFLDLTRVNARLDFPSGSAFLAGASRLAQNLYNSQKPDCEAVHAICPDLTVSIQQQIVGPISFRADSKIKFDPMNINNVAYIDESVFAIDWALKVLGSAKASLWYSPKHKEAMVELRFFES